MVPYFLQHQLLYILFHILFNYNITYSILQCIAVVLFTGIFIFIINNLRSTMHCKNRFHNLGVNAVILRSYVLNHYYNISNVYALQSFGICYFSLPNLLYPDLNATMMQKEIRHDIFNLILKFVNSFEILILSSSYHYQSYNIFKILLFCFLLVHYLNRGGISFMYILRISLSMVMLNNNFNNRYCSRS